MESGVGFELFLTDSRSPVESFFTSHS